MRNQRIFHPPHISTRGYVFTLCTRLLPPPPSERYLLASFKRDNQLWGPPSRCQLISLLSQAWYVTSAYKFSHYITMPLRVLTAHLRSLISQQKEKEREFGMHCLESWFPSTRAHFTKGFLDWSERGLGMTSQRHNVNCLQFVEYIFAATFLGLLIVYQLSLVIIMH